MRRPLIILCNYELEEHDLKTSKTNSFRERSFSRSERVQRLFWILQLVTIFLIAVSHADDWPQWRGPHRDGISAEAGWCEAWPLNDPPTASWRVQVGKGHSAVSVADDAAYTLGWDGKQDTVYCFDAVTGVERWKQSYPCHGIAQWSGPRATPTIAHGIVFTLGQHGQLRAWNAKTGELQWAIDLPASYQPDVDYGFPWSPLVEGAHLIFPTGSRGLAVRVNDGGFAWGNDGRAGACVSPMPFIIDGSPGVAIVTMDPSREHVSVVGIDPGTGEEQWRFARWPEKWGAACSDLIIHDNRVFFSTAEQRKFCVQFEIRKGKPRIVWSNQHLSTYTGNVVLIAKSLFGVDKTGILKCVDWESGAPRWAERGFGEFGSLIAADGKLIVQSGKSGVVTVVGAVPDAYRELRRAQVFEESPETFTAPVLANGRLYCRSYAGEVVCLNLVSERSKAPGRN